MRLVSLQSCYTDLRHGQLTGIMLTYSKGSIRIASAESYMSNGDRTHQIPLSLREHAAQVLRRGYYFTRWAGRVMLLGWEMGDSQNSSFVVRLLEGKGHRINQGNGLRMY